MRAAELLTALTYSTFDIPYSGVYLERWGRPCPFTMITTDNQGNLFLYYEKNLPSLSIKQLLLVLMLNKSHTLYYWNGKEFVLLFGYKEIQGRILLSQ
ncbi:hypothetical protein [Enterococcus olivae]